MLVGPRRGVALDARVLPAQLRSAEGQGVLGAAVLAVHTPGLREHLGIRHALTDRAARSGTASIRLPKHLEH